MSRVNTFDAMHTSLQRCGLAAALTFSLTACHPEPVDTPIAFLAQTGGTWQVWIKPRLDADPEPLTHLKQDVSRLSWYPSADALLVNLQNGQLLKVDAKNGRSEAIRMPMPNVLDAVIGPDGHSIAFSAALADSVDQNDLWVVDSASGQLRKVVAMPGLQHEPAWSADGKTLYFLSGLGGSETHDIWTIDLAASGPPQQVTINALYHFDIAVRGDGAIAFSGNRSGDYDLWWQRKSGAPERLTEDAVLDARPSWSADGERLVYESIHDGVGQLWLLEVRTQAARSLTAMAGGARMPVWAPTGGAK
jgi:TolB protein